MKLLLPLLCRDKEFSLKCGLHSFGHYLKDRHIHTHTRTFPISNELYYMNDDKQMILNFYIKMYILVHIGYIFSSLPVLIKEMKLHQ